MTSVFPPPPVSRPHTKKVKQFFFLPLAAILGASPSFRVSSPDIPPDDTGDGSSGGRTITAQAAATHRIAANTAATMITILRFFPRCSQVWSCSFQWGDSVESSRRPPREFVCFMLKFLSTNQWLLRFGGEVRWCALASRPQSFPIQAGRRHPDPNRPVLLTVLRR